MGIYEVSGEGGVTMTTYQLLCITGVASILPTLITLLIKWLVDTFSKKAKERDIEMKRQQADTELLKKGIQALLRAQMIADWNKWSQKGYAPIYAKENFENIWEQYHLLGANGVMDDIHIKFLGLPTEP